MAGRSWESSLARLEFDAITIGLDVSDFDCRVCDTLEGFLPASTLEPLPFVISFREYAGEYEQTASGSNGIPSIVSRGECRYWPLQRGPLTEGVVRRSPTRNCVDGQYATRA